MVEIFSTSSENKNTNLWTKMKVLRNYLYQLFLFLVAAATKTETQTLNFQYVCRQKCRVYQSNKLKLTILHVQHISSLKIRQFFVEWGMQIEKKEKVFMIKIMLHFSCK